MSLDLNFIEKGSKTIQHLGEVRPGQVATFAGYTQEDEPVVYALACLSPSYRKLLGIMCFGSVHAGDASFVQDGIKPGDLTSSNNIGNIAFGQHWCREVISDEHEVGLLLAQHIPDTKSDWSLS